MADTISTKRITDLPEDTDVNDNDLFMAGSNGTASLRKKKWSTLLAKIKSVLLANNLTTTTAGYALDARQGKALKDQLDQQNTNINTVVNVESVERQGNANSMVTSSNRTAFYKISASSGTTANNFPVNSAGCLMVMNLYGIHIIQAYFALGGSLYVRSIVNAPEAGSSWTEWREK